MLTFKSAPDYEMPTDMGGMDNDVHGDGEWPTDGTYMDTRDVTVMVTNVNEAGEGDPAGYAAQGWDAELMATLTDLDMVVDMSTVTWQWTSSDPTWIGPMDRH